MADKELKIQITTTADTSGAEAAAASLQTVEAQAAGAQTAKPGDRYTGADDLIAKLESMKQRAAAAQQEAGQLALEHEGTRLEDHAAAAKGRG